MARQRVINEMAPFRGGTMRRANDEDLLDGVTDPV